MSTKQKTKQQSSYSNTVTPTAPGWISGSQQQTQNLINQFKGMNPSQFVAGSSPLQNMAFAGGQALANRMGILSNDAASGQVAMKPGGGGVSSGGPATSGFWSEGSDPTGAAIAGTDPNFKGGSPSGMGGPSTPGRSGTPGFSSGGIIGASEAPGPMGLAPNPNDYFAQAGLLANAAGNAGANTAERNTLGDANTAGRNVLGDATQSQTGVLGDAPMIGDIGRMDAAQIGEADIARLMNPYQRNVIDASLSQYDASRDQAAARMAADAAGRGAFSDGRYGIAEGEFNAGTARDRASLEAGLLSSGFNTALSAAENDVARRQQAGAMNFDANLQRLLANQGVDSAFALNRYGTETQNNQFNAANQNAFRGDQFAADNQRDQFNVNNQNVFARDQFGADNALNMFNAQQGDTALARQLQAAGLLGDLGATMGSEERANLGLLSGLGEQQRGVNQDQLNAIPQWLSMITGLESGMGYGNYFGQTGSGTSQGTTTQSQNPFSTLAGLGGAWLMGGGGNPFLFGQGGK